MNERQFRQIVANRRVWSPERLGDSAAYRGNLRSASRSTRVCELAYQAVQRALGPWASEVSVDGFCDGVLTLSIRSAAARYEVARRIAKLRTALGRGIPELGRIEIKPAQEEPRGEATDPGQRTRRRRRNAHE